MVLTLLCGLSFSTLVRDRRGFCPEGEQDVNGEVMIYIFYLKIAISPWPASMSKYMDHRSQRLGCESTIPSKIVLPRSGSPSLYSNWANLDIVFRSKEGHVRNRIPCEILLLTFPFLQALQTSWKKRTTELWFALLQVVFSEQCPYFGALAKLFAGSFVLFFCFL